MAADTSQPAEQTRLALRTVVAEHGPETLSSPRALSNLLADLLPDSPRIVRILVAAAQEHISEDLRDHTSAGMDPATASRLAASTFADETMFPLDVCTWVVGEIALALGLTSENSAPPATFSPSVAAAVAAGSSKQVVAGPEKSAEPAQTLPEPPELGEAADVPTGAAAAGPGRRAARQEQAGVGRHRAAGKGKDAGGAKPRGGGLDPGPDARIRAPFPAAAGLGGGAGLAGADADVEGLAGAASTPDPASAEDLALEIGTAAIVAVAPGGGSPAGPAAPDAPAAQATQAEPDTPAEPTKPARRAAPAATSVTWTAVVTADRAYFDGVIADGHVEAASIEFPSHYPERRFELTGTEMRIGRRSVSRKLEPEIDLAGPPTDPGISHLHAVLIAADDGTWSVLDRGSSNGTQVNGREIAEGEQVPLRDGDRVCVGAWTALTIHAS
jgi:hypothetical protein